MREIFHRLLSLFTAAALSVLLALTGGLALWLAHTVPPDLRLPVIALWWVTALALGLYLPAGGCSCVREAIRRAPLRTVAALLPECEARKWLPEMEAQLLELGASNRGALLRNLVLTAPRTIVVAWLVHAPSLRRQVRGRQARRRALARQTTLVRGLSRVLRNRLRREPGLVRDPAAVLRLSLTQRAMLVAFICGARTERDTGQTMWRETRELVRFAAAVSRTWSAARRVSLGPDWWSVLHDLSVRQGHRPATVLARCQARLQILWVATWVMLPSLWRKEP